MYKRYKFQITINLINLKVHLPEYKLNFANLEFRIINPNAAQIYATSSASNLEKTLIQSARLTLEYYEAVFHHTVALKVCTNFNAKLLR